MMLMLNHYVPMTHILLPMEERFMLRIALVVMARTSKGSLIGVCDYQMVDCPHHPMMPVDIHGIMPMNFFFLL